MGKYQRIPVLYGFVGVFLVLTLLSGCGSAKPSIVGTWEPTGPQTTVIADIDQITWTFDADNKVQAAGGYGTYTGTYTMIDEKQIQIKTDNVALNGVATYKISNDMLTLEYPGGRVYAFKKAK
jgi:hypothetical protein